MQKDRLIRGDMIRLAKEFPSTMRHFDGRGELAVIDYWNYSHTSVALKFIKDGAWSAWYPKELLTFALTRKVSSSYERAFHN